MPRAVAGRVELPGFVTDDDLVALLAGCLGVVYAPYDEDYGYVTLQAFLAGKPVITTTDSGGVLEWVEHGVTGLVVEPTAEVDRRGGRPPRWGSRHGRPARGRRPGPRRRPRLEDGGRHAAAGRRVTRPLLAVKAAGAVTASPPLRALLRAMAGTVEVRALLRCRRRPDAVLVTGRTGALVLPGGMPAALWVGSREAEDVAGRVIAVGHRPGPDGVRVPEHPVDADRWPPIGPAVRRRWRQRLDLPDEWVVRAPSVPPEDRPTALALCASAVVYADLPLALALGTPVVTGAEPAAAIGAGDEVLVPGPGQDLASVAAELAADEVRAARLSRLARARAERDLDIGGPARQLLERLRLVPAAADPAEHVAPHLAALGCRPGRPHRRSGRRRGPRPDTRRSGAAEGGPSRAAGGVGGRVSHPAIDARSVARLRSSRAMVATGDAPEDEPRPAARAKKAARRAAAPLVARLRTSAAEAVNPELQVARREIATLRADLDRTRAELEAEIELLRAELDARN